MNLGAKRGAIHVKKVFFNDAKTVHKTEKSENWFSAVLAHMGAKKKLVARILKSEPLILKSKPLIFHPVETALKHALKMRIKRRHAPGQPVLSSNKHANRPDSCRCRVDTYAEVIGRLIKPKTVIRELSSNVECVPSPTYAHLPSSVFAFGFVVVRYAFSRA